MTNTLKALATLALTAAMATGFAQTAASSPTTPKKVHRKPAAPKGPSVQAQIEELRQQQQADHGQIDTLKQQLADRDAALQAAQQAAAAAQAAAQAAQQAANAEQQTISANTDAVSSLQSSVTDLKANSVSLAGTIQEQQTAVKKAIENPDAIHYKGITLSPAGSFIAAETVWRQGATGSDVNTPFTSVPLQNSDNAQLSEFFGTGRQSRIALKASGKLTNVTLSGYYEADWLGTGITSNSNQSNSYVFRQRQLWTDALFNSGWDVSGGAGWSLATETTQGETRGS
jgi:multidrug efflux pump subunit AcrA (membrane-fusion protein)